MEKQAQATKMGAIEDVNPDFWDESYAVNLKIFLTFKEQYFGWKSMNIFEKQWVLRDFKKSMALSADQACDKLKLLNDEIQKGNYQVLYEQKIFIEKLKEYWKHQLKLLKGYEKNKNKLEENSKIIEEWILDIEKVVQMCSY